MTFEFYTFALTALFTWAGTAAGSNALFAVIICAAIMGLNGRVALVLTLAVHLAVLCALAVV